MAIKATFLVTDMDFNITYDKDGQPTEHKTEKAALKDAAIALRESCHDEVWVWRLSHIVSRPNAEPDVEKVK